MDKILTEGFIARKLAKTDKGLKADTVFKVWCTTDNPINIESAKKAIERLEKESEIDAEVSVPYGILLNLGAVDYPQSKFNKIAKKCKDKSKYIDYTLLLWCDEDDPNYESKKKNAERLWKAGQYKIIAGDGGGNYLIYSLRNGKFFDYFHEQDTGENLEWLKTGVTYKDAINHVKSCLAKLDSNKALKESVTLYEAMEYIDNYLNEATHRDPMFPDHEKVHGTKARIIAGAAKEIRNSENEAYKRNNFKAANKLHYIRKDSIDNYADSQYNSANLDIRSDVDRIKRLKAKANDAPRKVYVGSKKSNEEKIKIAKDRLDSNIEKARKLKDEHLQKAMLMRDEAKKIMNEK